ncbi:MAG: FG-GAP repeat protein, partial [Pirellulales bacterium]|nr:FG-GAP repeat protein [Pirellulales bacterium]
MRLRSKFVAAFCASVVATMSAVPVASAQGVLSGAGGAEPQSQFGSAVASGSDLDGDGVIDLIVGARFEDAGLPDRGVVRVFSGKTGTVTQSLLGPQAQARFGTSVASIGDVNGDGVADFAVAAPGAGIASMRSGSNGASLWTAPCDVGPSSPGGSIPALVCALGDVNGDGIPDVAIARSASGAVDVRRGQNGVLIKTITDPSPSGPPGTFGAALSPAGDLDFDGIVELAIGSP